MPFIRWSLAGSGPALGAASVVSVLAGVVEVMAALILGRVIDAALGSEQQSVFSANVPIMLGALAFFVIARPLLFWASSYMQSIVIAPNMFTLIGIGVLVALKLWPATDPVELEHIHDNLPLDHPHLQGHRRHSHALVIDDSHCRWATHF